MKKIVLYGAGAMLDEVLQLINKEDIYAIVDRDKKGDIINGFTISEPTKELLKKADEIVITSTKYRKEILVMLYGMDIENIYVYFGKKIVSEAEYYKGFHREFEISRREYMKLVNRTYEEERLLIANDAKLWLNREKALEDMPTGKICAEVGVAYGDFSEKIMHIMKPKKFYAIDYFSQETLYRACGYEAKKLLGNSHEEIYRRYFNEYICNDLMEVKQGLSWEVLNTFEDNFFDYVYLDADHTYESVVKDIEVLYHKMKPNGIIQFNDFTDIFLGAMRIPGVKPAVFEFLKSGRAEIIGYCMQKFGNDDIVVRVKK